MTIPKIAIVGRPNVGKSALFNRIIGKRLSIVDDSFGVTRDRLYARGDYFGRPIELIDTAGITPQANEPFQEFILRQTKLAIEEADSLIMVVDAISGIVDLDVQVARLLKKANKTITLAINKVDSPYQEKAVQNFFELGIQPSIAISAAHNIHIAELLELALRNSPVTETIEEETHKIRTAIIGRANVGKSSFINKTLGQERVVVSEIPGTTRDSIDIDFQLGDDHFVLIDTAGLRRVGAEHEVVDKFARIRTEESIRRTDVCVVMVDATQGITEQEKRIISSIEEEGKGLVLLVNKWDLMKDVRMEHYKKNLHTMMPFLAHCPLLFISALTGRNLDKVFSLVKEVYENCTKSIPTPRLNKFLEKAMQLTHPPMIQGKRLRIYYMAQTGTKPPRFTLFINYPDLLTRPYKKYLINQFRKEFDFNGTPLVFIIKGKSEKKAAQVKEKFEDNEL